IRDVIRVDMRVVRLALHVYQWFVPVQNLQSAYDALVDLLRRETDYRHEAACMQRMAQNFGGQDDVLIPEPIDSLTTMDVLTMTFMEGIKITEIGNEELTGISKKAVAKRLTQCSYEQIFVHRFFHADPHPGNFLVQRGDTPDKPRLVILDFGAISEVSPEMVDGMIEVLQGFFEKKDELVLQGVARIGFMAEGGNRELLEKTVITYFRKLLKIEDRTPGALMRAKAEELERLADPEVERRELRGLMKSVHYPDGWFYVERASVLLFWLVGQIDPDVDTLKVGFPYILPLLMKKTAAAKRASP
ncbi:MAG: AarF/ABC1/UbiB kinase family protein, partial [Myxococcales bacterium]|nr:AarF/ABC1/UbiB kinase family protein [Myxococcales bacterium]